MGKAKEQIEKKPAKQEPESATDQLTRAQQKLADKFAGMYAFVGMLVASRDIYDGLVIATHANDRANELIRAARHNKELYKWLERMANGSDFGALILGHGAMIYAILAHHDKAPKNESLLASLGYSEQQILAPPPGLENGKHP